MVCLDCAVESKKRANGGKAGKARRGFGLSRVSSWQDWELNQKNRTGQRNQSDSPMQLWQQLFLRAHESVTDMASLA